ncbi:HemK/PrmC family methyltransferase [soil metagenome]
MTVHLRESMRFGGVTIEHDDRVLRPRPWTELQSRWAAELLAGAPDGAVLELCCGAGHIGLLVASLTGRPLVAVDLNPAACYFTRLNAEGAGLTSRVEVREGRLEEQVGDGETFALVVADPPWVTSADVARHPEDPLSAIDGGDDGLAVARACIAASAGHLLPGGSLLLQLGSTHQAERVLAEAVADGWLPGARRDGARGVVQQLVAR